MIAVSIVAGASAASNPALAGADNHAPANFCADEAQASAAGKPSVLVSYAGQRDAVLPASQFYFSCRRAQPSPVFYSPSVAIANRNPAPQRAFAGQSEGAQHVHDRTDQGIVDGDEIVVTARKREERLQDVPVSVTALNETDLVEKQISSTNELLRVTPGLFAATNAVGNAPASSVQPNFSIRGQTSGDISGFGVPPGVVSYFAYAPDFSGAFYDLASIQVLKGPQGTLFGRNTTGGAILITPKKPTDEVSGYAMARVGTHSRFDQEFALGGAIVPGLLAVRVAGQNLHREGYTASITTNSAGLPQLQKLDDEHRWSVRASLVFTPTANLENYVVFQYDHVDEAGAGLVLGAFSNVASAPYRTELASYLAFQNAVGPRSTQDYIPGSLVYKKWGIINTTTMTVSPSITVKNIFRYSKGGSPRAANPGGNGPYRIGNLVRERADPDVTKTEEIQLQIARGDFFNAVAGFYYEDSDVGIATNRLLLATGGASPSPYNVFLRQGFENVSTAGFVEGTIKWQGLAVTVGARRTNDRRTSGLEQTIGFGLNPTAFTIIRPYTTATERSKATTWNVALDYHLSPDALVYGTVRRGFKAGGVNLVSRTDVATYKPEYITDYEVGLKTMWRLGAAQLRANLDAFYSNFTNIQRLIQIPAGPTPSQPPGPAIANAARARIVGIDLDLALRVPGYFDASFQYTYLSTKYLEYHDDLRGDLSRGMFPFTPKHQLNLTTKAYITQGSRGDLDVQVSAIYQSKTAISVHNVINGNATNDLAVPGSILPGYTLLNFRANLENVLGREGLSAAVFVNNVTNKVYRTGGVDQLNISVIGTANFSYGPPRMAGAEVRYRF